MPPRRALPGSGRGRGAPQRRSAPLWELAEPRCAFGVPAASPGSRAAWARLGGREAETRSLAARPSAEAHRVVILKVHGGRAGHIKGPSRGRQASREGCRREGRDKASRHFPARRTLVCPMDPKNGWQRQPWPVWLRRAGGFRRRAPASSPRRLFAPEVCHRGSPPQRLGPSSSADAGPVRPLRQRRLCQSRAQDQGEQQRQRLHSGTAPMVSSSRRRGRRTRARAWKGRVQRGRGGRPVAGSQRLLAPTPPRLPIDAQARHAQSILDLEPHMNKAVRVKCVGGRECELGAPRSALGLLPRLLRGDRSHLASRPSSARTLRRSHGRAEGLRQAAEPGPRRRCGADAR